MKIPEKEFKKASNIAEEIMKMSRNSIMVKMRFLDVALFNLELKQEETTYATDGRNFYYGVEHLLGRYLENDEYIQDDIMHVLLHCIFRHFYVNPGLIDHNLWDLSCDIAVEAMVEDFVLTKKVRLNSDQLSEINKIKSEVKELTAEKIYRYYLYKGLSEDQIKRISSMFKVDDHSLWYTENDTSGDGTGQEQDNEGNQSNEPEQADNAGNENNQDQEGTSAQQSMKEIVEQWESISKRVQVDMETASFGKIQGIGAGGMLQNLRAMNRERYDYSTFLKKFAVMGEAMKINDDEFDYILYTYGLKKYGNMPLIEPLEYKEVKRIKDFVIAIDTSGSVAGELVQKFLQKTYNILKQTDTFFSRFNLHIIQCDAAIQEAVKITKQEEFDEYIKHLAIKGLGGTDFRPVFTYVNHMIENKEFTNLKGMIYFTDGYGTFPIKKPDYNTAFVFLRNEYDNPYVPPWAIKLVLEDEEV